MISAGGCIYFSYLEVTFVMEKKPLQPEIERFKQAYQRGELVANMTAKDMVGS